MAPRPEWLLLLCDEGDELALKSTHCLLESMHEHLPCMYQLDAKPRAMKCAQSRMQVLPSPECGKTSLSACCWSGTHACAARTSRKGLGRRWLRQLNATLLPTMLSHNPKPWENIHRHFARSCPILVSGLVVRARQCMKIAT